MYSCIPGNTPTGGGTGLGCVDVVLVVDVVLADAKRPGVDESLVETLELFIILMYSCIPGSTPKLKLSWQM